MAFRICVILLLAYFSASFIHEADAGLFDCPNVYYNGYLIQNGFDCPRSFDASDDDYCCDSGKTYQKCCTYYEYYGYDEYFSLSVGAIIGIAIGSLVFIVVVIVSIIACCVCCVKATATPTHHPVTMHTVNVAPQQPGSVTVPQPAAPGYYYPPSTQSVPLPNYVNQQAQQPAQQPPLPGENPAYQKY
ncbi:protein shisa-4-like [Patiria miniata]|uniref:Uncharacterized protein n=1 Tax=Patiria miniata TaxID=46514 RepID=A0A914B662_PATMI|nr:protein shisa-4-like [Patiria miniata]